MGKGAQIAEALQLFAALPPEKQEEALQRIRAIAGEPPAEKARTTAQGEPSTGTGSGLQ